MMSATQQNGTQTTSSQRNARLATRFAFFVAGFGLAAWAPLIPFSKARLGIDDGILGILLLCLGLGSVTTMMFTGGLTSRYGSRRLIVIGGCGLAVMLPILAVLPTPIGLGAALIGFGAFLGTIEVAMNVHAVEVEKQARRPLMSGFHAFFSIGGFAGAGLMTLALSLNVTPLVGAAIASFLMIAALCYATPRFIDTPRTNANSIHAMPRGTILVIAGLAAVTFLTEGAILDWSALLLSGAGLVAPAQGGVGYMTFAIAMTIGRLGGDAVATRLGDRRTMVWGGVISIAGYIILLSAPVIILAGVGFLFIGLGASNIVPVLFRQAGAQTAMPPGPAIAAVTTVGYAGILVGPAGVGLVADAFGLPTAFWVLAAMLCLVPLCARIASNNQN